MLSRNGISLLEVLISMFVLLVGLLGVASLIPVGKIEIQRGMHADMGGACGRAALRDLKIRGLLNLGTWARPGGDPIKLANGTGLDFDGDDVADSIFFRPVMIDPLGVSLAVSNDRFPAGSTASYRISRITLGLPFGGTAPAIAARSAMADTIFRMQDDLVFEPSAGDAPPMQRLQMSSTAPSSVPLKRLWEGDYSWLATVTFDPNLTTAQNLYSIPMCVSVAVFYKRNLSVVGIGERACNLDPLADGENEARLRIVGATPGTSGWLKVDPAQYLNRGDGAAHLSVKSNRWVLLVGYKTGAPTVLYYAWHKMVAIDDTFFSTNTTYGDSDDILVTSTTNAASDGHWFRNVTLVGPFTKSDSPIPRSNITVLLLEDVIEVYERQLTLEE